MNENQLQPKRGAISQLVWMILPILILVLNGCQISARVPDTPITQPTSTQESIEHLSELATLTQQAIEVYFTDTPAADTPTPTGTPVLPTSTPTSTASPSSAETIPSSTPDLSGERIRFYPGGTMSLIQRNIRSEDPHLYTFNALNGQTLIMAISSPDGDVTMGMERVDTGKDLISPSSGYTDWVGTIPVTGAYQLIISTNNPDTYYFLMLEIPANIFFETGATSETISGYVEVFQDFHPDVITRVRYMAYAREDQTMEISLGSPNLDSLAIGVIGQSDGKEYINYEVKSNHFEMDLPSTQGYFIDIYSVGGVSTDFSLQVEIE